MKTLLQTRVPIRALAGGVGLLTTLGLAVSMSSIASANASANASAKKAPHFRLSAAQATAIVLKKFPGKVTEKIVLEDEEGTWQYGVMVRSGRLLREVMVDAKTGKIANVEVTTVGKEQVEQKAETAAEAAAEAKARKPKNATAKK